MAGIYDFSKNLGCLATAAGGGWIRPNRGEKSHRPAPSQPRGRLPLRRTSQHAEARDEKMMSRNNTIIYTRNGCHLCQEAEKILKKHGLSPQPVNIDLDSTLQQRYSQCVPVVLIDGKERFRGRVDERLLRRILRSKC